MNRPAAGSVVPRGWQRRFLTEHAATRSRDFLLVATPGAGKTLAACLAVQDARAAGRAEQVVVVCPTTALRAQWADAADRVGLHLDPRWRNADGAWRAGVDGVVVTYQQVATAPDLFAHHLARPTAVVMDELHHAGDATAWGSALQTAFGEAALRLALSGTPFRSDARAIPFVTYDEDRCCVPDHVYGYADAVLDGACRPLAFRLLDATLRWRADGEETVAAFADPLDPVGDARRLRAAIDPGTPLLGQMLKDADDLLVKARSVVPDAAGLLLADTQQHARDVAAVLRTITGERPTTVLSDDPTAHRKLETFAAATEPRWLVAVSMVSEGVDVPRLTVAAYATVKRTDLFFRQAVGRIVRRRSGDPDDLVAQVFLPADDILTAAAERVEAELRRPTDDDGSRGTFDVEPPTGGGRRVAFEALDAYVEPGGMIVGGVRYDRDEVAAARGLLRELGQSERAIGKVLTFVRGQRLGTPESPPTTLAEPHPPPVPAHRRVQAKRAAVDQLARRWGQLRRAIDPTYDHRHAQARVNSAMGVRARAAASEADLDRGLIFLTTELHKLAATYPDHAAGLNITQSTQGILTRLAAATGEPPGRHQRDQ
ncbi:DNA helicase [Paraconexibacter sp. AEG42_29]|uniref:DNA helicase n=1 Tax=Paraconexibacter sp. AEG42_29 TaxID=2997339 RepID=A0AAU7ATD0_9ACTN